MSEENITDAQRIENLKKENKDLQDKLDKLSSFNNGLLLEYSNTMSLFDDAIFGLLQVYNSRKMGKLITNKDEESTSGL